MAEGGSYVIDAETGARRRVAGTDPAPPPADPPPAEAKPAPRAKEKR